MKKQIISILMLICMLCGFTIAQADDRSPSIYDLYWSDPEMPFELIERNPEWPMLYKQMDERYNFADLTGKDWGLDEAIIIHVDKTYRRVTWHFPSEFKSAKNTAVILVARDMERAHELSVRVQKDDGLLLNFATIPIGEYYMLVFTLR